MIMLVLANWFFVFARRCCAASSPLLHFHLHGFLAIWAFGVFFALLGILWFAMVERASIGFGRLKPTGRVDVRPGTSGTTSGTGSSAARR